MQLHEAPLGGSTASHWFIFWKHCGPQPRCDQLEKKKCTYSELQGRHKPGRGPLPCLMPTCVPICRRAPPVVLFLCQGESSPSAPLAGVYLAVCVPNSLQPPDTILLLLFLGGTGDQMSKSPLVVLWFMKRKWTRLCAGWSNCSFGFKPLSLYAVREANMGF